MSAAQTGAMVCAVWLVLIGVVILLGRAISDLHEAREVEDREHEPCPLYRLEDYR